MNKQTKKKIHINNSYLYLKEIEFSGTNKFEIEIKLTNREDEANDYEIRDIPKILQILRILGFDNAFAEDDK